MTAILPNNLELPFEKRLLYFDEPSHSYTDDRGIKYTSTTTVIHGLEPAFDSKGTARRLARQNNGFYAGKSAKQIEKQWSDVTNHSCEKGSNKHDNLETNVKTASKFENAVKYLKVLGENNRLYTIDDILSLELTYKFDLVKFKANIFSRYPIIYKTVEWYIQNGYEVYAEVGIYDPVHLISGMIDLLVINRKTKHFVIIDWKTNKDDLLFNSGYFAKDKDGQMTDKFVRQYKYYNYPLDNLEVCKGNTYSMQLSIYAYMMELRGYICDYLILFHIRDHYILNKYSKPFIQKNGLYIVDEKKKEYVQYHMLKYLKSDVDRVFENHLRNNVKNENFKLNF